jgi:hypothetical protein
MVPAPAKSLTRNFIFQINTQTYTHIHYLTCTDGILAGIKSKEKFFYKLYGEFVALSDSLVNSTNEDWYDGAPV